MKSNKYKTGKSNLLEGAKPGAKPQKMTKPPSMFGLVAFFVHMIPPKTRDWEDSLSAGATRRTLNRPVGRLAGLLF